MKMILVEFDKEKNDGGFANPHIFNRLMKLQPNIEDMISFGGMVTNKQEVYNVKVWGSKKNVNRD